MKFTFKILFFILTIMIFSSCKDGSKKEETETRGLDSPIIGSDTNNNFKPEEDKLYVNDSTGLVASMTFNTDGSTSYYSSSDSSSFRSHHSGLEYKFIKRGDGKYFPKPGDIIYIDLKYNTDSDSTIFNSKDVDENFKMRVNKSSHLGGSIEDAFSIMREGDSAIFKIDASNFFLHSKKSANIPKFIKQGSKLTFFIKIEKIENSSEFINTNKETYSYYIEQENSLINRYILNFDYPITTTKSGLRILKISKGEGKKPEIGNTVSINYTVGFIDGGVFDSTLERNEPFMFRLGSQQVIPGLEEAILNMNIGEHSIIIVPFQLGYGDQRQGVVAPFSTLVFEIDLLDAR